MALDPTSRARFNLTKASVLLLDSTAMGMQILVQIVSGLGAKTIYRCATIEEAQDAVHRYGIDLIISDAVLPDGRGYEFVQWLRREVPEPNCYVPVLLTAGHTPSTHVARSRDCGANFIVKKPLSPMLVLERIIWVAKEGRSFLVCDTYAGPDRRFKDEGMPDGIPRRREDFQDRGLEPSNAEGQTESAEAPQKAAS